jgi:molecular chaperone DnaK
MTKIIGIDLGTTNSVVAVMEGGDPVVIPTLEGSRLCPSVVAFNKNKQRLVGDTAKRQAIVNSENTISSIKRFIGHRFDEVSHERQMVAFRVNPGPTGDARVKIPITNKEYTPQEISAMILAKLKNDAESYLGESVTKAVITVPAYFNDSQRQATKDAGRIAGLDVLRIINEPTASALAYGLDKKSNEKILIFDLGGGTFDVSVLEVGDGVFEVKSTNGDTHLGGDDWDELIVNWAANEFRKNYQIDLREDRQALQRLREAAEKAKIDLSSVMESEINLPYITADINGPKHLNIKLTRSNFEKMSIELINRLKEPFDVALNDAGLTSNDLDEIVLVGGSTRMPMIQELVQNLTGKAGNKSVNPDEVVAIGAAIQGGILSGQIQDVLLLDVTPLSLGIETMGKVLTKIIERNTTIPVKKSQIFSTAEDNQPAVDIHVLQGERQMVGDNISLGMFRLDGIGSSSRGVPQIEVTFDIDANGILNVSAMDKATGKEQKVTITASTNLNQNEIDRLIEEAKKHESDDKYQRELIEMKNMSDQLIYRIEKDMKNSNGSVKSELRDEIDTLIQELKIAISEENVDMMRSNIERLQAAKAKISPEGTSEIKDGTDQSRYAPTESEVIEGEFYDA